MFFSIITVSLNAESLIADTLNSAISQTFKDFEIVVKDGGSRDKTLEMIPSDERIRVIQKNDKGIYEGMNQAIAEAKGKYLIFMNCGDLFYDNTVLEKAYEILKDGEERILYGDFCFSDDMIIRSSSTNLKKSHFYYSTICHQASFIPKSAFEKIGYYDESLKISSDWEFFLDAFIGGIKYQYYNEPVCIFLSGGVSWTDEGVKIAKKEKKAIKKTRFSLFERIYIPMASTRLGQWALSVKRKITKK